MTRRIAFVHGGSHAQLATLADPALGIYNLTPVHIRDLARELGDELLRVRNAKAGESAVEVLSEADAILVSDRLRQDLLALAGPALLERFAAGVPGAVFGENRVGSWFPQLVEHERPTIFWWWRTGEPHRKRRVAREHPAQRHFSDRSVIWHSHGVLELPADATSLVDLDHVDGSVDGSILAVWEPANGARVLVSTMDPVYHHGSGFMPGATQLLYRSLAWLADEIAAGDATNESTTTGPTATTREITLWENGLAHTFTFADCMRYHGPEFPGGVAHAFAALGRAIPALEARLESGRVDRRALRIRTPFGGPGARDAFELMTRSVTGDRYEIIPDLARPERGTTLQRYVFEFSVGEVTVTSVIRDTDIVVPEFIELTARPGKGEAELERLEVLKREMRDRILALPPEEVYDLEG